VTYFLGVDLGTTYTAAAIVRDGRTATVDLGTRTAAIPSVVFLRDDETILTGEAANRRGVTEPSRVAREFKRRVGDTAPLLLGGAPYSADALVGRLLRWVVDAVSEREGAPPAGISVTHPANWGPYKQDLLRQAIARADLDHVATITEPEAAVTYYASQERVEPGSVIAVYDLGGGTFDAAVVRKTETGVELLGSPEGIERLGGVDFDEAVFSHVAATLGGALEQLDPRDPSAMAAVSRLRAECVEAKEALSADTEVSIPILLPNVSTDVRLTRGEFEAMIRPPLADSLTAMRRALRSAGVEPAELTTVLLAGGSSRIPLVAQMVGAELGRPVAVDAHPKHGVALGAAQFAAAAGGAPVPVGSTPVGAGGPPPVPAAGAPGDAGTAAAAGVGAAAGAAAAMAGTGAGGAAPIADAAPAAGGVPGGSGASASGVPPASATGVAGAAGAAGAAGGAAGVAGGAGPAAGVPAGGAGAGGAATAGGLPAGGAAAPTASAATASSPAAPSAAAAPGAPASTWASPAPADAGYGGAGPIDAPGTVPPAPPADGRPSFDSGGPYRPPEAPKRSKALPLLLGLAAAAAIGVGAFFVLSGGDDDGGDEATAADDVEETAAPEATEAPEVTAAPSTAATEESTTAPTTASTLPPACPPTQTGPCIEMRSIAIDGDALVIEWDAFNFTPDNGDVHAHFFWNNQLAAQAGTNAERDFGVPLGAWELTDNQPFRSGEEDANTPLFVSRKPPEATHVCVTAANAAHEVLNPDLFHCLAFPA
jgi:actin-like ATPase involved in cell morphogenesis